MRHRDDSIDQPTNLEMLAALAVFGLAVALMLIGAGTVLDWLL